VLDADRFRVFRRDGGWCAECLACQAWLSIANQTKRAAELNFGLHWQQAHSDSVGAASGQQPVARFIVRAAFTVTRIGTCIGGYTEHGTVRLGDELLWFDGKSDRRSKCRGVMSIREVPIKKPPTVGLAVTDAFPEDFREGMVILAFRATA
jgi:hypothetical protein